MAWSVQGNLKGPAGTLAIGTVTTGAAGSQAQATNSGTDIAAILNLVIPRGDKGEDGKGVSINGSVATYGDLPTGLTSADAGKGYFVSADGRLYVWDGAAFPADGAGIEFRGPIGPGATITLGTVTTGAPGSSVVITNSGTATEAVLNFTIPRGDAGQAGAAATIAVGTVTTGAPGSQAAVNNVGSPNAAVFNITIPTGADGARGTQWFFGHGAPGAIAGSAIGDKYLDLDDGTVYELS